MAFRIRGLSPEPFRHLYGLSDTALASHGAKRVTADADHGYPDRIEMRDARVGEQLLLVNFEHHAVATPYRASYAVYVLEGAEETYDRVDEIPEVLAKRLISLRGFSVDGTLLAADVMNGSELRPAIAAFFANAAISYLHAHNAKAGCYAGRVDRVN